MNPLSNSRYWDAIIVGGGCAGMACATKLAENGKKVLVLERRNILGGRACSYEDPQTKEIVDNGQHLFLGCYTETIELLKRVGTEDLLRFNAGFETPMLGIDQSVTYLKTFHLPAPFHLLCGFLNYRALTWKERLGIFRVAMALRKSLSDLKNISCTQWLDSLNQSKNARKKFWDLIILATLNVSPDRAPANLLATVLREGFLSSKKASRVGLSRVGLTDLYAIPSKKYLEARGSEVWMNQTVTEISFEKGRASVVLHNGTVLTSKVVVSTVPPSALLKIQLKDEKLQTFVSRARRLQPSPILSFHFWANLPAYPASYMGFWGTQFHWAFQKGLLYNDPTTKHWTLVASNAADMMEKSKDELTAIAKKELELISEFTNVEIQRAKIVHEREATWVPPLGDTSGRLTTVTPISEFLLAGDWTDTDLPCTIESAVVSGHRAAISAVSVLQSADVPKQS